MFEFFLLISFQPCHSQQIDRNAGISTKIPIEEIIPVSILRRFL